MPGMPLALFTDKSLYADKSKKGLRNEIYLALFSKQNCEMAMASGRTF